MNKKYMHLLAELEELYTFLKWEDVIDDKKTVKQFCRVIKTAMKVIEGK